MEDELLDFIDWYNVMYEDLEGKTSREIVNMYMYFLKNKI
tara:strand:- start:2289 stop:2408 length:120 start_codon:yes stop_codon:yes gene_type:complete